MQKQKTLFPDIPSKKNKYTKMIGANLSLVFNRKNKQLVIFKNRGVLLAEERKAKRIENQKKQMELDFEFGEKTVSRQEQPFNTLHDWKFTRYAGVFPYLIVLIGRNQWLKLIMGYFGSAYKIF